MCDRRLKELLRAKLVECGWKDQLKAQCKGIVFVCVCNDASMKLDLDMKSSIILCRCDQRKGSGACHSGGPGHRSHTKRQRYRSPYANTTAGGGRSAEIKTYSCFVCKICLRK